MGNRAKDDLEPCGTPAAYKRHQRHGEDVTLCPPCCQAESVRCKGNGSAQRRQERMGPAWRERYAAGRAAGLSSRDAHSYSRNGAWSDPQEWKDGRDDAR